MNPYEAVERQRSLIVRTVRLGFFILIVTVVLVTLINEAESPSPVNTPVSIEVAWYVPLVVAIVMFAIAFLIDLLTPRKKIATLGGVFLGLVAGMVAAVAMSFIIDLVLSVTLDAKVVESLKSTIGLFKLLIGICLCYLAITTVLQTQDDFRLVIPYVEFAKQIRGVRPMLMDSAALIDARIVDVVATGLIQSPIIVPRFVLLELQTLADSSEKLKRARGRRGLDVVTKLQRLARVEVTIDETPRPAIGTDTALVELARHMNARIVTTDLGLARIGQIHGVTVVNLHEVAHALKPSLVPGEQLTLRLVKAGEQAGQGVGYLDDGTMVVVDQGASRLGDDVPVLVASTMQTAAGRLVFAKLLEIAQPSPAGPRFIESGDDAEDSIEFNSAPSSTPNRAPGPTDSTTQSNPKGPSPTAHNSHGNADGDSPDHQSLATDQGPPAANPARAQSTPRPPSPPPPPAPHPPHHTPSGRNPRR